MSAERLDPATAARLPSDVERPARAVAAAGVGIVHLGPGAFHRAHQAAYTQAAMAVAGGNWAIRTVALRSDRARLALEPQAGLYTLRERGTETDRWTLQAAIRDVVTASNDAASGLDTLIDPNVHVLTLTVTEAGYALDTSGSLDHSHPDVVHDLESPAVPCSAPGWVAAALAARRRIDAPLTVFSCDNLRSNGRALERAVRDFIQATDPSLLGWVDDNVTFPNAMVDRIVPATRPAELDEAAKALTVRDDAHTACEPFTEWVIEKRFATLIPAWETVGAKLVDDVATFEETKLKLLNGAHSSLVYAACALDIEYVHEAMGHPVLERYLRRLLDDEIRPHVVAPPGEDLVARIDTVLDRFRNPHLGHRCAQIAMDGSLKIRERLLPVAETALNEGRSIPLLTTALACWLHHVVRHAEPGAPALLDARADQVLEIARGWTPTRDAGQDRAVVKQLMGPKLGADDAWVRGISETTRALRERGVEAVLEDAARREG